MTADDAHFVLKRPVVRAITYILLGLAGSSSVEAVGRLMALWASRGAGGGRCPDRAAIVAIGTSLPELAASSCIATIAGSRYSRGQCRRLKYVQHSLDSWSAAGIAGMPFRAIASIDIIICVASNADGSARRGDQSRRHYFPSGSEAFCRATACLLWYVIRQVKQDSVGCTSHGDHQVPKAAIFTRLMARANSVGRCQTV